MAMELKHQLRLAQQLRMTPQLQQAIKLLQLSSMELTSLIAQELIENPALEEMPDPADAPALQEPQLTSEPQRERDDGGDEGGGTSGEAGGDGGESDGDAWQASGEAGGDGGDGSTLASAPLDDMENWQAYLDNASNPLPTNSYKGMNEDLPSLEATLTRSDDLYEHLMAQVALTHLSDDERLVAMLIIGNLDEHGYLTGITLEEIALEAECSVEFAEEVLEIIQQEFDPAGVGARDLKECLLIQARLLYDEKKDPIFAIIERHIPNLEKKRYDLIAKDLGKPLEEVIQAAKRISKLEPRPGRMYAHDEPQYITPDIYVHKVGDEYVASINDDGIPKLKVSAFYRDALTQQGNANNAKRYVQEKVKNAAWLIQSIYRRQRTILKVTNSIIKFQHDFLEHGINHLKPLVLRDVAEDIEMHESTISRVTTNKYVHTPQGIFELKFFFNSPISKVQGEDIASEAVKTKIKQIVSTENPKKPLSDADIVEILNKDHNIDIARRTVAKYREMLGILPSNKRKRLF
jgi:RNA polymerase sigma-54 factor